MNEFIAQFILESRDLVEQATAGLAALEQAPADQQWIDATFRAIHTLKGGAAIVEFAAMERLVHAVEDALGEVRLGKRALDKGMVGACLASLDQVMRWLDAMEQSGAVPEQVERQVEDLIARLIPRSQDEISAKDAHQWLADLFKRNPQLRSQAKTAIRFAPHSESFFKDEDPIEVLASLPQLLALEFEPAGDWPTLQSLDPMESILVFGAVTASPTTEVRAHLQAHLGECEIVALSSNDRGASQGSLPEAVLSVLQAQLELLASADPSVVIGCIASAGMVAGNVLRFCSRHDAADLVAQATASSLSARDPRLLRERVAGVLTAQYPAASEVAQHSATAAAESHQQQRVRTLRIDAERVDALMRLTGELSVVKNAIGHTVTLADEDRTPFADSLRKHHAALDHLVTELQSAVLGVRVLPLRTVLQRFPRLVREMSESLNKEVTLVIQGDETEADKTVVEMLFEPLLHILRNAMDHGIESAAVRAQGHKPARATILMRASRQGGHIHVEVEDDGAGIDLARIREKARDHGLIEAARLDVMSDAEVAELIFAPGFSTAEVVTDLSGRGVGMDVVRTTVERIGGRVSVDSRNAGGTCVKLTLPFSVMMTRVLTAEVSGQIFAIPLESVVETLSVSIDEIKKVGAAEVIVHRDRTIPIYDLAELLCLPTTGGERKEVVVLIASVAGHLGGIRVDRLGERMEIMLKPLDGLLASVPGITGTSILGDGRVLLVLDLAEVFQ